MSNARVEKRGLKQGMHCRTEYVTELDAYLLHIADSPQSLQEITEISLRIDQDRVLPNTFQFIYIILPSNVTVLTLKALLNI